MFESTKMRNALTESYNNINKQQNIITKANYILENNNLSHFHKPLLKQRISEIISSTDINEQTKHDALDLGIQVFRTKTLSEAQIVNVLREGWFDSAVSGVRSVVGGLQGIAKKGGEAFQVGSFVSKLGDMAGKMEMVTNWLASKEFIEAYKFAHSQAGELNRYLGVNTGTSASNGGKSQGQDDNIHRFLTAGAQLGIQLTKQGTNFNTFQKEIQQLTNTKLGVDTGDGSNKHIDDHSKPQFSRRKPKPATPAAAAPATPAAAPAAAPATPAAAPATPAAAPAGPARDPATGQFVRR